MESNSNKKSLADKNSNANKGLTKQTIQNFLNKGSSNLLSSIMPHSSKMESSNPQFNNEKQSLIPQNQSKYSSILKKENADEESKTDNQTGLANNTLAEILQIIPSSLSSVPSILKPSTNTKQKIDVSKMEYLTGSINNISSLVKTDKNDFLGTGSNINNFTQLQKFEVNKKPPQAEPTLQNIVSTWDLKCKLDLKTITLNARNTEYSPKRFAAAIMKIRNPKTTALIFSSGKMVWTGAKSEEDSKKAAKKYAKIIKKIGFDVRFTDFKVQNIVASADVGFAIRLESLSHEHAEFCQYEPEIFPGLIYRILLPKVVVLIFVSGKIVLFA